MIRDWWKKEIEESLFIGWRGFGPILGTRYYLKIDDDTIRLIRKSPLRGIELQYFSTSTIVCTDARRPSMFYSIFGAIVGFFGDLFRSPEEILNEIHYSSFIDFINFILFSLFIAVVFGTILDRLFERPRINLILEGGINIGTFTNFKKKIPEITQAISVARGANATESMRSIHRYYVYQARAM